MRGDTFFEHLLCARHIDRHFRFITLLAAYEQFQVVRPGACFTIGGHQDSGCMPLLEETCFVWNEELTLFLLWALFRVGGMR